MAWRALLHGWRDRPFHSGCLPFRWWICFFLFRSLCPFARWPVQGWLDAGGRGIDTALNYGDQTVIAEILAKNPHIARSELFLTSKIPAGLGGSAYCNASTAAKEAYAAVQVGRLVVCRLSVMVGWLCMLFARTHPLACRVKKARAQSCSPKRAVDNRVQLRFGGRAPIARTLRIESRRVESNTRSVPLAYTCWR